MSNKKWSNKDKLEFAEKHGIKIPSNLKTAEILNGDRDVVGIYGFFARKNDQEFCFYIGKSVCLFSRLFDTSNGHVYHALRYLETSDHSYLHDKKTERLVPTRIVDLLNESYKIEIKILEVVEYHDTEYSRAAHRLALAELKYIVLYQEQGQCLEQLPEGSTKKAREYWERNYQTR